MLAQGGLLGLGEGDNRGRALRPFPGGQAAAPAARQAHDLVVGQQKQAGGHRNGSGGQQLRPARAAGGRAPQGGLRALEAGIVGPHRTGGQLGQAKGGRQQVVGARVLKGQPPAHGPAENPDAGQLRPVGFVELALEARYGGAHRFAGLSDAQAQTGAQGIHEQPVVAGQGLIEGHQLGGRAQRLPAGPGTGGRYVGHEAPKIRNYHAVVVAEQGADVVGEMHSGDFGNWGLRDLAERRVQAIG